MVIGKTSSSISKSDIFSKYTETQILATVFPEISKIPCIINSPLRPDEHPSFSIYLTNGSHIAWKDHATNERGGLMDLLCAYWHCNFRQALDKICAILIDKKDIIIKSKQVKTFTRKESDSMSKIQVVVRPWKDYDYKYWESYGIEKQWLKYAEIYPISHKIVIKKDLTTGKENQYIFASDKYAYCFVERKEGKLSLKCYQPFNTKGYKWCSKMTDGVISLWSKVPEYGNRIVICSSVKDALCISCQLHIPAIAPQGEGYNMSETAINELKRRYKKVFISFDTDVAGLLDGQNLAEKTGFTNIVPELGECKDYSDYYKSLENKEEFKKLETLFH